jgi:hypothetical protein
MKSGKWIYCLVVALLVFVYYAGEATDLLILAMLIILPVGFWILWNINPS